MLCIAVKYGEQYRVLLAGTDVSLHLCYPAHIVYYLLICSVRSFFLLSKQMRGSEMRSVKF